MYIKISNDILTNKDNNESTGLVCIDLSAAFDLVDHSILLKRLFHYFGIRGTALAWFKSYLTGRSQRVLIDDVRSDKKQLRQGVPQGSVLGAKLYTLYVDRSPMSFNVTLCYITHMQTIHKYM